MITLRRKFFLAVQRMLGQQTDTYAPHGIPVVVPHTADLAIRYLLARREPYEAPEADMVMKYLQPGTPVIELGGCMGIISALVRSRIGPEARHVIVEANAALVPICLANATRTSPPQRTEVVQAAIDYSGAMTISFDTGICVHGGHVIEGEASGGVAVPTIRLADLVQTLPEGPFALISDVEGAEVPMIAAEAGSLARVDLLIMETHPNVYPNGEADLAILVARITASGLVLAERSDDVFCFRRPAAA